MKRILLTSLLLLWACLAGAQDPYFTQYFASPLSLNPANTGFIDGKYRVAMNYRQQWWNVGEAYSTASAALDFNLLSDNTAVQDKLGIGAMVIRQESLDGILKGMYAAVSGAYHKQLSEDGRHMLGIGLQAARSHKQLNYSRLSFESQFTGNGFDHSIPVDFQGHSNTSGFWDVNAGILYSSLRKWGNYYGGLSVYHLTNPSESIYSAQGTPLRMRRTLHAGASYNIDNIVSVIGTGVYMQQGDIADKLVGSAISFQASNGNKVYAGIWYRFEDSLIPYIGIDYRNFSLGLYYGVAVPGVMSYRPRTAEFSIIFRKPPTSRLALCPRF